MMNAKRILAVLLTLAWGISLCPLVAQAAHDTATVLSADFSETRLAEGVYRLDSDVTYGGDTNLALQGEVVICLNGYTLDMGSYSLRVNGQSLTVCDCGEAGTAGTITGEVAGEGLIVTNSNCNRIHINGAKVENTAADGIGIYTKCNTIMENGAFVSGGGYAVVDYDKAAVYLGDVTLNGSVKLYYGLIYAFSPEDMTPYTGDTVSIELDAPTLKMDEGGNSIVQRVTDDNVSKFVLTTSVEGYMMVRQGEYLKLKKQLDDTATMGVTVTVMPADADRMTLAITPKEEGALFLFEPTVIVDGTSVTPEQQADGSYTISLSGEEAAKYIQIDAVAGLPLEESLFDVSGLENAVARAVIADGRLAFWLKPILGYRFVLSPNVTLDGAPVSTQWVDDIIRESVVNRVAYNGEKLVITGQAAVIPVMNVVWWDLIGGHASALVGMGKDIIITISPDTDKEFVSPPTVMLGETPLAAEYIARQEDGSYMATVPNGQDCAMIEVAGIATVIPTADKLVGATVTTAPGEADGEILLTVTPLEGMEFLSTPTLTAGENAYSFQKESDGRYIATVPTTDATDNIVVVGYAGRRLELTDTLTGGEAAALLLEGNGSENLMVQMVPAEGYAFVQGPTLLINGSPVPDNLVIEQPDGSYLAFLVYTEGDVLAVDGLATLGGVPLPDTEQLSGASVTTTLEEDGSVTVTVTPEAGKEFATPPTVTVGETTLTPEKQEDGRYTAVIPAEEVGKAIVVAGTAQEPGPDVLPGDVDESGEVNAADALLALQIATNKVTPTDIQTVAADVDGNPGVSANDALLILQYATKKIAGF